MEFELKTRETGASASKKLRKEGFLPAVIYGNKIEPVSCCVSKTILKKENFYTEPFKAKLDGKEITLLPKDVQYDPVTGNAIHIDFLSITADTIVKALVPIEVINRNKCKGIRSGGVLTVVQKKVLVKCGAGKIPLSIEVDVGSLDAKENIRVYDLKTPDGVIVMGVPHEPVITITGARGKDDATGAQEDAAPEATDAAATEDQQASSEEKTGS